MICDSCKNGIHRMCTEPETCECAMRHAACEPLPAIKLAHNALGVIVLTQRIRAWLEANDPKAYQQARDAFLALGGQMPTPPVEEPARTSREGMHTSIDGDYIVVHRKSDGKTISYPADELQGIRLDEKRTAAIRDAVRQPEHVWG